MLPHRLEVLREELAACLGDVLEFEETSDGKLIVTNRD